MRSQCGFTLLELLVVLVIGGVVTATSIVGLRALNSPLQNGAAQITSFIKQVRARAVSTTAAYSIVPISATRIITRYGNNCADTPTDDAALVLNLPTGAHLPDLSWAFCFSTRGLADGTHVVAVTDDSGTKNIEILLGGSVRVM